MHISEFEIFSTAMRPRLLSRAMAVVKNRDTAEDVVQDSLLKLWSIRQSLDDYESPEALALTIVHRLSLNQIRDHRINVEICDSNVAGQTSSPEEDVIAAESDMTAHRLLAMLPDSQRTLIKMRHEEGLSNGEIAQVLGMTDGAVRTALSRARCRIAEIYINLQNNKNY